MIQKCFRSPFVVIMSFIILMLCRQCMQLKVKLKNEDFHDMILHYLINPTFYVVGMLKESLHHAPFRIST